MIDGYYTDHLYQFLCIFSVSPPEWDRHNKRLQSGLDRGRLEQNDSQTFLILSKNDLEAIHFCNFVGEDVNESMNDVIDALYNLSDKHAPL